jgi:hypothetical protein
MRIALRIGLLLVLTSGMCWGRDWKIYYMPNKHLDVGFIALPQDALDQRYPGSLEDFQNFVVLRALYVRKGTEEFPAEARYKWYFDGAWQLEQIAKDLPSLMDELQQLVNTRCFSYNPIYANLHTLYLSHEQMMRMMTYSRTLEKNGFRHSYVATQSDVPTVGWGFASALASAGIKYFLKGTWYNSPYSRDLSWVEPAPLFWWVGPDGRRILVFYHGGYGGAGFDTSLTRAIVEKTVEEYEALSRQGKWPYDAIPMFGSEGDFGVPSPENSAFVREWNKSHDSVKLLMATPEEFFEYIESHFGDKIPDGGPGGWGISYDLIEANAAKPEARSRRNDHLLSAAEAFSSLSALSFGTAYPTESLREAWLKQVLFHEHTFGMLDSIGPDGRRQYAWKNRLTEQAEQTARLVLDAALRALSEQIPSSGEERFAVFNSFSFPQSGLVDLPLDQPLTANGMRIVEADTNREVPIQVVESETRKFLRLWAGPIPPFGYKCYRIEHRGATDVGARVKADARTRTLENQYYRLTLAPDGGIANLLDKELNQEIFALQAPYRGNQFVFKNDAWQDASPASATTSVENAGPVSSTLRVDAAPTSIFCNLTARYTLYDGIKRLDIENTFTKQPGKTASNETVFYAFPFAMTGGQWRLDIPGVVARYPQDFRSETDWSIFPAQSFVSVASDGVNVVLATRESPDFEFGSMRKFSDHPAQPDVSNSWIFAQPLTKQTVNKDDYDWEGGTYRFNYALTTSSGAFRAADALRFAWGFQRGFETIRLRNPQGRFPVSTSFLEVDSRQVIASAMKQADDGRGLIVRLWNPGEQAASAEIRFSDKPILTALHTDLLERDTGSQYEIRNGKVVIPCAGREFVTVRLLTGK